MISALNRLLSSVGLYARIFVEAIHGNWRKTLAIFALDVMSAVASSGVMLVLTLTLAIVATGEGVDRIGNILSDYGLNGLIVGWSPLVFVYGAGIASVFLFACTAALRYVAALLARAIARRYHRDLIHSTLQQVYSSSPLIRSDTLAKPGALSIATIQNTIHASKGVETLLRLPQTVLFVVVLAAIVTILRPVAASLLALVVLAGAPVIYMISRNINRSSGDFYSSRSRAFGQEVANRLNSLNGHTGTFPEQSPRLEDAVFQETESLYLDSYDTVQLASERVAFFSGIVRGLGYGAGLIFVIYTVSISQEPLSEISAFAVLMYLMVAYLSNIFGSMSSLLIFLPQVVSLDRVRSELARACQQADAIGADGARFPVKLMPSIGLQGEVTIRKGDIVSITGLSIGERFEFGALVDTIKTHLSDGSLGNRVVLMKSIFYNFPNMTIKQLDLAYRSASGETLSELALRLGISSDFGDWYEKALSEGLDSPLSADNWRLAPGQVQGFLIIAIARSNSAIHYFLDRTIVSRFHRQARDEAIATFGNNSVLWLYSSKDEFEPVRKETIKLSIEGGQIASWAWEERLKLAGSSGAGQGVVPPIQMM
jgi:ABC-type multidrug transport system fused ATPase/permease subunit